MNQIYLIIYNILSYILKSQSLFAICILKNIKLTTCIYDCMTPTYMPSAYYLRNRLNLAEYVLFFFSVSYNVCPSRIKRYSMFYKMKDTRWNSLIQASTTLQRFKFFVTLIYLDIYYILYVLFQCKVRYIIIMYLFTNDKIFGDILPDAMQTFSSLDPRVLIKESGSGISWKEKKRKK